MSDGNFENIIEWFKNAYLPIRLLERNMQIQEKDKDVKDSKHKLNMWFRMTLGNSI